MTSNKGTSLFFKIAMSFLGFCICTLLFFTLNCKKNNKETTQVTKPVTTAKVVAKTGVASRVVRDDALDSKTNRSVTTKLDLSGMSFDLKNAK